MLRRSFREKHLLDLGVKEMTANMFSADLASARGQDKVKQAQRTFSNFVKDRLVSFTYNLFALTDSETQKRGRNETVKSHGSLPYL